MNYELAKELHDLGFRKDHELDDKTASYCLNCPFVESYTTTEPHDGFTLMCYPTLSELIEACGDCGFALIQAGKEWRAYSGYADDDYSFDGQGKTPEEAVAKLWLILNNK